MPRLQIRPVSSTSKRDISPMGTSRFEQPLQIRSRRQQQEHKQQQQQQQQNHHQQRPMTSSSTSHQSSTHSTSTSSSSSSRNNSSAFASPSSPSSPRPLLRRIDSLTTLSTPPCSSPSCTLPFETWLSQSDPDPSLGGVPTDLCPDGATLASVAHLPIYDSDNQPRTFGSLYDPATNIHERQLIIFVRHFFCGACQAYLSALTRALPAREYFGIPVPTSIVVIGCGKPHLIPHYRGFVEGGCPFRMFADPSRELFRKLGMGVSVNIGKTRPGYMEGISAVGWVKGQVGTVRRSLKDPEGIRKRDVLMGGNPMQIGGEFLFENGRVVWCHRMRNYRNHAEVGEIRKVLGLDE